MNPEEMEIYYESTGKNPPLNHNCLCDEIQEIEITLHVDTCTLVDTHHKSWNSDPKDNEGLVANPSGYPNWFLRIPTTWKPTLNHPSYWIDKFYPVNPPSSY